MADRNDEVTARLTVGDINLLLMLAEEGFKAIAGKLARQLNDQTQRQEPGPRPVAAE